MVQWGLTTKFSNPEQIISQVYSTGGNKHYRNVTNIFMLFSRGVEATVSPRHIYFMLIASYVPFVDLIQSV